MCEMRVRQKIDPHPQPADKEKKISVTIAETGTATYIAGQRQIEGQL